MNAKCFHALLIFSLCGGVAEATRQPGFTISLGAPIERELPAGQAHTYRIVLSAGQFALAQVEQRGANVSLAANGPDGKEFAHVNLRNTGEGGGAVGDCRGRGERIHSESPVGEFDEGAAPIGRYKKISELRPATKIALALKRRHSVMKRKRSAWKRLRNRSARPRDSTRRRCRSGGKRPNRTGNQRF